MEKWTDETQKEMDGGLRRFDLTYDNPQTLTEK